MADGEARERKARRGGVTLEGSKRPQLRKARAGSWTAAKRSAFIEELAATCNVAASLRTVGMSAVSVYKLRKRSAEFRAQWAEALREGYAKLEMMLIERAMNGTVKTVTRAGGAVDKTREYPNHVALALLRMHKDKVGEAETAYTEQDLEEVRRRIVRKVAAVNVRAEREEGSRHAR